MKTIDFRKSRLISAGILITTVVPTIAAQMTNNFGDRPKVTEATVILTADTTDANLEPDEQLLTDEVSRKHTVWAEWVAPANGTVTMDTLGTTYVSAMIRIFTGAEIPNLSPVARGIDPTGPDPAKVIFPVAAGQAYQIMLDSTLNNTFGDGPGTMNIRFTPEAIPSSVVGEDVFANRRSLTGPKALAVANNKLASLDPDEVETIGSREKSIWWEWTAPTTGKVTIDTLDSDFDTTLTVFAGSTETADLFPVLDAVAAGSNIPNSTRSRLSFQTEAGRTYQINVDGGINNTFGEGNIVLRLSLQNNEMPAGIPGADSFSRRGILTGMNATGVGNNHLFSIEAFEPAPDGTRDKTAWWQWTAPADGLMILDTLQSNPVFSDFFKTSLRLYSGSALEFLQEIGSGTEIPLGVGKRLAFTAEKGKTYQIVVDGGINNIWGEGNIVLNLNRAPAPEISVQQPVRSELTDGITKKSFGTVAVRSKSLIKTFTITNTGNLTLSGLSILKKGIHRTDFVVSDLAKTSLAPGESIKFTVKFTPQAEGTRNATLQINSNDVDENPFDIRVTGMGLKPL